MTDSSYGPTVELGPCIGKGSFSHVYKVILHRKEGRLLKTKKHEYALKIINLVDRGVESPIELAIMTQIRHPHLTHALKVEVDAVKSTLQILAPLAIGNLSSVIKAQMSRPSMHLLKKWMMQLMSAVATLHLAGILHGDIKASNTLVFNKPRAKSLHTAHIQLNDFSLSNLILNPQFRNHRLVAYTNTHRAPEIWNGSPWGYEADIWALACTFYEMVYGSSLFPSQKRAIDEKLANIEVHKEWQQYHEILSNNVRSAPPCQKATTRSPKTHYSCMLHLDWTKPEMSDFNKLLLTMLTVDPYQRPTIFKLIIDPFFADVYDPLILPGLSASHPHIQISQLTPIFNKEPSTQGFSSQVINLGSYLYGQISWNNAVEKNPGIYRVCMRIAYKLIHSASQVENLGSVEPNIIVQEVKILEKLKYRLLPYVKGNIV
jgi:serine/threonine protein kinase